MGKFSPAPLFFLVSGRILNYNTKGFIDTLNG